MRCAACDKKLTDYEATRKCTDSGSYLDLCNHCFSFLKGTISVVDRSDLFHDMEIDDGEAPEECTMSEVCCEGSRSVPEQSGDV
jgi:hypothetical protein